VKALRCHESQVGSTPEIEVWLRDRALQMAEKENYELAEAFHRLEILR